MSFGKLSRRKFLKTAGTGLGAAALTGSQVSGVFAGGSQSPVEQDDDRGPKPDFWEPTLYSYNKWYGNPPMLGRVTANRLWIFEEPNPNAKHVRPVYLHYVAGIWGGVRGERYDAKSHSVVWFDVGEGYLHSAFVSPCKEIFNPVRTDMPEEYGFFWGEVTVPMVTQWKKPRMTGGAWDFDHYRGFFGQVHKIVDYAIDDQGMEWYRLEDDIEPEREAWMLAKTIRYIPPQEFLPINPDVEDKKIIISLDEQLLTAYENGNPVFQTRIASGTDYQNDEGEVIDFSTPLGQTPIQRKRPSRRMRGGSGSLAYDVNAVPWVSYFSAGAAIHGAFWHNNYGLPRSHGCINVLPDAAKWIYRWSQPYLAYDEEYRWAADNELATPVQVVGVLEEGVQTGDAS